MGAVAPVAQTNAQLFTDMATTFQAIDKSPSDLEATIAKSPSTEQVSTQSLAVQRPFLVDLNTLGTQLAPATAELRAALPDINPAIETGTKTLVRTPALNANLQQVMDALKKLAQAPGHQRGRQRADRHRADAQPDGPVPRPVPDRVRRLELLLDLPVRAHLRGHELRLRPAGRCSTWATRPSPTTSASRARRSRPTAAARRRCSPAATSSCTRRCTAPPWTTRATPTARPASAATRSSSTTSTRPAATSPPTPTRRATRARHSAAAPTCPPARRSAATPPPVPQLPSVPSNP